MAFKKTQVTFNSLKKLSMAKRMQVLRDPGLSSSILDSLTPSQFAELFPKYYERGLPDISGFRRAISKKSEEAAASRQAQQDKYNAATEQLMREAMSGRGPQEFNDSYKENFERASYSPEGLGRVFRGGGFGRRGTARMPSLTPEQEAAFNKVRSGNVLTSSDEGKIFSKLSNDQLASVGVSRSKDENGRDIFKYSEPTVGREEAESRLKTASGGNRFFDAIIRAEGTGKYGDPYNTSLGYTKPPKPLTEMTMKEVLAWGDHIRHNTNIGRKTNSSAKGAFQMTNQTQQEAMRALGIGMDEKFSPENQKKLAAWAATTASGLGRWEGFKAHPGEREIASNAMREGLHRQFAGGDQQKPPTDDQIDKMMDQLRQEKNAARKQQFANVLIDAGVDTATVNRLSNAKVAGSAVGGFYGESQQCVALSKHFAPQIGPASSWKVDYDPNGIVPGAVIATTNYGKGAHPGGVMARNMPDGKSHYHTGIALTRPDADGKVLILDQSLGRPSRIHTININNYNGEKWGPVQGGGPTERSMQAVNMALNHANDEEKKVIQQAMRGEKPTVSSAPSPALPRQLESTNRASAKPVDQEGKPLQNVVKEKERVVVQREIETKTKEVVKEKTKEVQKLVPDRQPETQKTEPVKVPEKPLAPVDKPKDSVETKPTVVAEKEKHNLDPAKEIEKAKAEGPTPTKAADSPRESSKTDVATAKPVNPSQSEKPKAAEPTQVNAQQPQQPVKEAPKVVTAESGGSFDVNSKQIEAYPISGIKSDNTVVVNQKQEPLFTMNTNRETAQYDPASGKVDVTPTSKVDNNINQSYDQFASITGELASMREDMKNMLAQNMQPKESTPRQDAIPDRKDDSMNLIGNIMDNIRQPIQSPSMYRAMERVGAGASNHYNYGDKTA